MKIKGLVNNVIGEFEVEPVEIVEQDEPITFNSKAELDNYITEFIIKFLTEGNNG